MNVAPYCYFAEIFMCIAFYGLMNKESCGTTHSGMSSEGYWAEIWILLNLIKANQFCLRPIFL